MAFINIKINTDEYFRRFTKDFQNMILKSLNKNAMTRIGGILAEDIKRRTRLGFGVKKANQERTKLKKLSDKYVKFRKDNKGKLLNLTTPKRSNLTFSGQLLDSLTAQSDNPGKVTLRFLGVHKNLDGSTMNNGLLANFVSKARPFLGPTNREIQRLKTNIKNQILKSL